MIVCASSLEQGYEGMKARDYSLCSLDRRYRCMSQYTHSMSHVFLMIVEKSWVGHNYERFAPSQYIEYGPGAWTIP